MVERFRSSFSVLLATTIASFLTSFTTSSITIALPTMATEFRVSLADVNWVANIFLLAVASTVLVVGRVSDWLGRERVFTLGTALFAVASVAIVLSSSYELVLAFRFLQGVASSMITGTAVAILSDALPRERRGMGIGINVTAVYLGLSLGPLAGGYMTAYLGWRSIFILKTAIALLSLAIAALYLGMGRGFAPRPSMFTALLEAIAVVLVIYGTSAIGTLHGLLTAVSGWALLITWLFIEYRKPQLLHTSMFRRGFLSANTAALLNYSATYALTILLSTYLQKIRNFTPSEAGLILTAQPVAQAMLSPVGGMLADRYNPSALASLGMAVIAVGITSLTPISRETMVTHIIYSLVLLGIGFAFFASPNATAIMNMSPREAYGTATSLLATMRSLGQALSTSIITAVMSMQKDLLTAIKTSLTIYIALSIAGVVLSLTAKQSTEHSKS